MSALERLGKAREELPGKIGEAAVIIADNPLEFAGVISGSYVMARVLMNLTRPRTPLGACATALTSYLVSVFLVAEARRRGILRFRIRDADGHMIVLGADGVPEWCEVCAEAEAGDAAGAA